MRVSYQFIAKPRTAAVTIGRYRHGLIGERTFFTAGVNLVRASTGGVRFFVGEHCWTLGRGECLLLPQEVTLRERIDFAPAELVYYFLPDDLAQNILSGLCGRQNPLQRGLKLSVSVTLNTILQDLTDQAKSGKDPDLCDDIVVSLVEILADREAKHKPLLSPREYAQLRQAKDNNVVALVKASQARDLLEKRVPVQKLSQILEIDRNSLSESFKLIWRRDLGAFADSLRSATERWKKRAD